MQHGEAGKTCPKQNMQKQVNWSCNKPEQRQKHQCSTCWHHVFRYIPSSNSDLGVGNLLSGILHLGFCSESDWTKKWFIIVFSINILVICICIIYINIYLLVTYIWVNSWFLDLSWLGDGQCETCCLAENSAENSDGKGVETHTTQQVT